MGRKMASLDPAPDSPRASVKATQPYGKGRPPTRPASLTRRSLQRLDGRFWPARRISELTAAYAAQLNHPHNPIIQTQIRACAELVTLCELRRAELLNGVETSFAFDSLIRLEGQVSRRLKRLGLDRPHHTPAPAPNLAEYTRSRDAAE
jgi:hypothetical protein